MTVTATTEIWIQEPDGFIPDAYIWACGNDRGIYPADGISVKWGKDDILSIPNAAVARFTLIDPGEYWIGRLRDRQVIGKPVVFYAKPSDGTGDFFWFRGRISSINVRSGPHDYKTGKPKFYFIDFTASDKTADFGQVVFPAGSAWPAETMIDRAVRIRNAAISVCTIADFFFDPDTTTWPVSPEDVSGKTVKEVNDKFYRSDGYSWSYIPSQNNVRHQRRTMQPTNGAGDANSLYLNSEAKVRPLPDGLAFTDSTYGTVTYRGIQLGGNVVEADYNKMYVDPGLAVNRVDVSWKASPGYTNGTTSYTQGGIPLVDSQGTRLMTYDSMCSSNVYITTAAMYHLNQAMNEGADIQHPAIHYDTKHTGGFDNIWMLRALIEAGEKPTRLFLTGSPWTAWARVMPMFKIQGGQIAYAKGRWIFDLSLQTLGPTTLANSLTWGQTNTGLRWGEGAGVAGNYGFDHSVTWDDIKYVVNNTTITANPTTL